MAGAMVGEAFLSAILQALFVRIDRMATHEVLEFFSQWKLSKEPLMRLKTSLLFLNAVLNDAEEKQMNNPVVKGWVNEIKDAAYQAQDLLDEIETVVSRKKLEAELKSKVQLFNLTSYKQIELRIEEILGRLKFLAKQRDLLGLKESSGGEKPSPKRPTTSLVEESAVYGREGDSEAIIELLLADAGSGDNITLFVSGEFCFRMEAENSNGLSGKTRYFSYSRTKFDSYEKFEAFHGVKDLRSFLPSNVSTQSGCLSTKVVLHLLPELRTLRVLSLAHYRNLTVLPQSVGNLIQLRYLNISHTAIKVLPDSVCTLYNLQTLLLTSCHSLTELPTNMGWLINLRHLDIIETNLKEMPLLMGRLKSLQTLTSFILGKGGGSSIKELGEFQQLKGSLSVLKLENAVDARDALEANLRNKLHLNELVLKWGGDTNDSRKDREILDKLQPHANLRKLTIENYGGTIFSNWLGQASCNIVSVQIHSCKYCLFLPPFGKLPSLEFLSIVGLDGVVTIGSEFYGTVDSRGKPFASLKTLRFKNMLQLQEWLPFRDDDEGVVAFSGLQQLYIQNCCNLTKGLPDSLFSLKTLVIEKCQQLVASLPRVPVIHELKLQYCNKVVLNELPPQVLKFTISGYDALVSLPIGNNHCLKELDVSDCPSLRLLPSMGEADTLKSLSVKSCGKLVFPMHQCYPSLESLCIRSSFDSFVCFPLELFPKLNHLDNFLYFYSSSSSTELGLQ
ncbi:hypothetical protein CMV_011405 [Castanea mollissima]|uniref:Rx N-terminal domain-containing protein n=1 Tax=Castanea mollissima TaxID=60419 RepID=A0A8J4VWY7_9ROSI|nr:hypothetical protein CMV_011405 [Castanea mollissima]